MLVNLQPAGKYLGEDFYRAGGVPAVVAELIEQGKIKPAIDCTIPMRDLKAAYARMSSRQVMGKLVMVNGTLC